MADEQQAIESPAWAGKPVLDANLVLEGGGMRGQFTAGVLDFLMDKGIVFRRAIGTSAGALNGYNYASGAVGRTCYTTLKYINDWRYLSIASLLVTGNICGRDFCFNQIPNHLEHFDYMDFNESPIELVSVSSDIEAGEALYHIHDDAVGGLPYLIASSSIPLVSRIVEVDGKKLLDGGACDSVPIDYSIRTGAPKHVVVLTQDADFVKQPDPSLPLEKARYKSFPKYIDRLANRHTEYNAVYNRLKDMHAAGEAFVMQPSKPVEIGTTGRDSDELFDLYCEGVEVAAKAWPALARYLEIDE